MNTGAQHGFVQVVYREPLSQAFMTQSSSGPLQPLSGQGRNGQQFAQWPQRRPKQAGTESGCLLSDPAHWISRNHAGSAGNLHIFCLLNPGTSQ